MKKIIIVLTASFFLGIYCLNPFTKENKLSEKTNVLVRPEYVDDRQWYRLKMRGGKIEPDKIIKGREIAEKLLKSKKFQKDGGLINWVSRGPGNIPGRVRALIFKRAPDKIFAGAAGGGIWKLDPNGNGNWQAIDDFLPSLAVTSFGMGNIFSNTIYASTGEGHASRTIGLPGAGIFKSTDGGESWDQLSSTNNEEFYWVNKLAVSQINEDHILAVVSLQNKSARDLDSLNGNDLDGFIGRLKESLDGGLTWSTVLETEGILTDIEFHKNNSGEDIRIISGHGELWVYDPSNGGSYNSKISQVNNYQGRIETAIASSDRNYIYAQINTLSASAFEARYRSTDGGSTWDFLNSSNEENLFRSIRIGDYANTVWVNPLDRDEVYFGGVDLYRSVDGGINITHISDWTEYHRNRSQPHADQHIILESPYFSPSNQIVYLGNDGGVQFAPDISNASIGGVGPAGYTDLSGTSFQTTQFYSASASPVNDKIGGGTQDNSFITSNTDSEWFQFTGGDGSNMLFHPTDADIIYANTNNNQLWKSEDGGITYDSVAHLGKNKADLISPIAINPAQPNLVYLGGKALWEYDENTGDTTEIKPSFLGTNNVDITVIEVSKDGNDIWVGYDVGEVHLSRNAGATWQTMTLEGNAITDIAINDEFDTPGGVREVIISSGGYKVENITIFRHDPSISFPNSPFITTDISLPFEMQVNTVTYHPSNKNWIYIGTDVGIFASEDAGQNWSVMPLHTSNDPIFNNEGPVYTEVSELFWDYNEEIPAWQLGAATFGRGIFTSNFILDTLFVDQNYVGGTSYGTRQNPLTTVNEAIIWQGLFQVPVIHFLSGGVHDINSPPAIMDPTKRVILSTSASSTVVE